MTNQIFVCYLICNKFGRIVRSFLSTHILLSTSKHEILSVCFRIRTLLEQNGMYKKTSPIRKHFIHFVLTGQKIVEKKPLKTLASIHLAPIGCDLHYLIRMHLNGSRNWHSQTFHTKFCSSPMTLHRHTKKLKQRKKSLCQENICSHTYEQ